MKRPEKMESNDAPLNIYGTLIFDTIDKNFTMFGHNSCCDKWGKFMPSRDEIEKIVNDWYECHMGHRLSEYKNKTDFINTITKRLGIEK